MGKGGAGRKGGACVPMSHGQGQGQWMFVPPGYHVQPIQKVQQHTLKRQGDEKSSTSPKTQLSQVLPLLLGRAATKDDWVFEMSEESGKYTAVLQLSALDRDTTDFTGKPAASKKEAEQNACKKALHLMAKEINEVEKANGKKPRNAEAAGRPSQHVNDSPKTRLSQVLPLLLGRSATKDDCIWEMREENGKHKAVLQIAALNREMTEFTGKPADSKMEAEHSAAQKALNVMAMEITEAQQAHEEVKKARSAEKAAANRERIENKKAEQALKEEALL